MKVKVLWGAPCSGKTTKARAEMGDSDVVFDYDRVLSAITTRTQQLTEQSKAHEIVLSMRRALIKELKASKDIKTAYVLTCTVSDALREMLEAYTPEYIKVAATKEICMDRLEKDENRPDKAEWKEIIEQWFIQNEPADEPQDRWKGGEKGMSFYKFVFKNATAGADREPDELYIDGEIADRESWYETSTGSTAFRERLARCGDVVVYINSPGGDVFAGAEMYSALKAHKGHVRAIVTGVAASAASVVAMAADEVLMSPVAYMMIHNPWTFAVGDSREMEHTAQVLREIGEGLIAAYTAKTGKTRDEVEQLLDAETWMSADRAVAEGFADGVLDEDGAAPAPREKDGKGTLMRACRYSPAAVAAMVRDADAPPDRGAMGGHTHVVRPPLGHTHWISHHVHAPDCAPAAAEKEKADKEQAARAEIAKRAQMIAGLPAY